MALPKLKKAKPTNGATKKYSGQAAFKKPEYDPDLAPLRRIATERQLTPSIVRANSWVAYSTAANIFKKKTRRPTHMTMVGIARASGYEYKLVKA